MIPQMQLVRSREDGQRGDCLRACVASILERPVHEVPHFVAGEVTDDSGQQVHWLDGVNIWLEREGYVVRLHHQPGWHEDNPGYWIAVVESVNIPGARHAIVMHGRDVAHDPSPGRPADAPPPVCKSPYVFYATDASKCRKACQ